MTARLHTERERDDKTPPVSQTPDIQLELRIEPRGFDVKLIYFESSKYMQNKNSTILW